MAVTRSVPKRAIMRRTSSAAVFPDAASPPCLDVFVLPNPMDVAVPRSHRYVADVSLSLQQRCRQICMKASSKRPRHAPPSRIVLCVGLKSSGSTWLYNAVIRLLKEEKRRSKNRIAAFYADKVAL